MFSSEGIVIIAQILTNNGLATMVKTAVKGSELPLNGSNYRTKRRFVWFVDGTATEAPLGWTAVAI
jgi:hypothetical protein